MKPQSRDMTRILFKNANVVLEGRDELATGLNVLVEADRIAAITVGLGGSHAGVDRPTAVRRADRADPTSDGRELAVR